MPSASSPQGPTSASGYAQSPGSPPQSGSGLFGPRGFGIYERWCEEQAKHGSSSGLGNLFDAVKGGLSAAKQSWKEVSEMCLDDNCSSERLRGKAVSSTRTLEASGMCLQDECDCEKSPGLVKGAAAAQADVTQERSLAGLPAATVTRYLNSEAKAGQDLADRPLFGGGASPLERRAALLEELQKLLANAGPDGRLRGASLPGVAEQTAAVARTILNDRGSGSASKSSASRIGIGLELPGESVVTQEQFNHFMKVVLDRLVGHDEPATEVILQQLVAEVRNGRAAIDAPWTTASRPRHSPSGRPVAVSVGMPTTHNTGSKAVSLSQQNTKPGGAGAALPSVATLPGGGSSARHTFRSAVLEADS